MLEGKYKFSEQEKEIQKFWEEKNIFKYVRHKGNKLYSVDTPPPTISGKLHIGHVASYTQAEVISRYKRLRGYDVFYPLGFDNNGLPTERLVEKKTGIKATDVSRERFTKLCERAIDKGVEEYKGLFQKLALSVDWDLSYQTIDETSRRISQKSFINLAKSNKAYRAHEPVQWCTECKTSIAQAEIDNKELPSSYHTINFQVEGKDLPIATTRPEYLPGCVAVMVNPNDKRYKNIVGKKAKVPIYNKQVPIIADEAADEEKGTGAVMCCTYGDEMDVKWCKKYDLPYIDVMQENGTINEQIEHVGGMDSVKARQTIVEKIKDEGLYKEKEDITHKVSVHERCDTPIEIMPSKQWFINVLDIKDNILKIAKDIDWNPANMYKRLEDWVENLDRDWLISRQRYFGVPFPVWYCKNCGNPIFADEENLPVNPLSDKPSHACSKCGSTDYEPESDVMDTWATSSVTQLINAKWKEKNQNNDLIPMSVRSQAREIIRTWAFYSIVKSYYHTGDKPWDSLMINGWVMFDKKNKISKSKHKMKDPEQLIKEYSADAIRHWATGTKLGNDMIFSESELKVGKKFINKLWNASKFSIMQLKDYDPNTSVDSNKLLPIDKWLLDKFEQTKKQVVKYLDKYEIGLSRQKLDKFFWDDYCDNYLEIAKERFYQPQKHGEEEKLSGQYTIYNVLYEMLQLYNSFIPHITEHIYKNYFE
ncbi:MAG: valine--tRNA ligase, partial [Candidatus Woesearchaeota archaeon]